MKFTQLPLISPLQKAISDSNYAEPTPIQEASIPIILEGKDLLGCAQTGTGKTAAFALPILQKLEHTSPRGGIKALIVTPTRELALQIDECFKSYGKYLNVRHAVIFGGVSAAAQKAKLRAGVQILVATPGRLLDLQSQGFIRFSRLEMLVLDEADRMLDMGFINDIRKILKLIPDDRQTLFFSATMPDPIVKLSKNMLCNPQRVDITPQSTTAERVEQSLYFVTKNDKRTLLVDLLQNPEMKSVLVFDRTKFGADKISRNLVKNGIKSAAIHGNKSQNARQKALKEFKEHKIRVLIATDIAARGIDVDRLSHVINYDLPNIPETYVHRIGRTGRAGREGIAISFCQPDEVPYLKDIEKLIKQKIAVVEDNPYFENFKNAKPEPAKPKGGRGGRGPRNSSRSGSSRRVSSRGGESRGNSYRGSSSRSGESRGNSYRDSSSSDGESRGNSYRGSSSRGGDSRSSSSRSSRPRRRY